MYRVEWKRTTTNSQGLGRMLRMSDAMQTKTRHGAYMHLKKRTRGVAYWLILEFEVCQKCQEWRTHFKVCSHVTLVHTLRNVLHVANTLQGVFRCQLGKHTSKCVQDVRRPSRPTCRLCRTQSYALPLPRQTTNSSPSFRNGLSRITLYEEKNMWKFKNIHSNKCYTAIAGTFLAVQTTESREKLTSALTLGKNQIIEVKYVFRPSIAVTEPSGLEGGDGS